MNDIAGAIKETGKKVTEVNGRIQEILLTHFGMLTEQGKKDVGLQAWGGMAVEVGVAIANMFIALKNPSSGRTYQAMCDLTYGLNSNDFWSKNANILLPAMHVALNAYRDNVALTLEKDQHNEYGAHGTLIAAARAAPLELFPLIAYCVGGAPLMVTASVPLKTDLAPYFL